MTGRGAAGGEPAARIVVLGGGLSGAAFAIHLIRDHDPDCTLAIVEPRAVLGAGLAYGTEDPAHRINVSAARMTLLADRPDAFDRWARDRSIPDHDPAALLPDGRLYPQRATFGRFVDETLRGLAATSRTRLEHVRTAAVTARPRDTSTARPRDAGFEIGLADGRVLEADILVLAASHTAPDLPPALDGLRDTPGLIADPWSPGALDRIAPDDGVLVVGTGLTGCDVVASLSSRGHRGRVVMVSRRGLLPRPRTTQPVTPYGRFDVPVARRALELLVRVRAEIADGAERGRPWEGVIDALRLQARAVWGGLPVGERLRLLRHLRPFWDAHRFQSAPQVDRALAAARAAGRLEVLAATPRAVSRAGGDAAAHAPGQARPSRRFRVALRPRHAGGGDLVREADWIVACTGPGHRSVVAHHPVLRALAAAGALRADPFGLGIEVDAESRVIRPQGGAWPDLLVAGPLARGTHGELMGLPQVSEQPREVARLVAGLLDGGPHPDPAARRGPPPSM